MSRLDASYRKLVAREVALRVAGKRKRAAQTPRKLFNSIGRRWAPKPLREPPSREQLLERILSRTKLSKQGCLEWQGGVTPDGYGVVNFGGETRMHRLVWWLLKGEPQVQVLHHCDNPRCLNVEHLFLGTQVDNIQDAVRKQRHRHGLSHEDVAFIRNYAERNRRNGRILPYTVNALMEKYDLHRRTIQNVIRWETYRHSR